MVNINNVINCANYNRIIISTDEDPSLRIFSLCDSKLTPVVFPQNYILI